LRQDQELKATLRNKLQAPLSALEAIKQGKHPSKGLIETALKDLKTVIKLIDKDK